MAKQNMGNHGYVYSTDPNFSFNDKQDEEETLLPQQQRLRVWLETRNRAGKPTSIIKGFIGSDEDLKELGKKIKNVCGTGGSIKEGEIIIQGDQREKILQWLQKEGFSQAKKAGS